MLTRSACARALARRAGLPLASTDFRRGLRRGRCAKRKCTSRYAVTRVVVDLRDPTRQDYSAVLECAECGHPWTSARVPDLTLRPDRAQHVALTLYLPPDAEMRTYRTSRGALRIVGTDTRILTNATYRDLAHELEAWKERATRKRAALGRRQDKSLTALGEDRIARAVEPTPDMRAAMERMWALQEAIKAAQWED